MKNLYGSAIYCYQNEAFYFSLYLRSYQSTNTIIIICALAYSTMIIRHIHVIIYYHRLAQRCVKQLTTVYAWTSRNECHQHIRSKTVFRFFAHWSSSTWSQQLLVWLQTSILLYVSHARYQT